MPEIEAYQSFAVTAEFTDIMEHVIEGVYWPEIDLPETGVADGTVVTVEFFVKRLGGVETPVGRQLEFTYPLEPEDRLIEAVGIRTKNGFRAQIKSTNPITVHKRLDRTSL